MTRNRFPGWAEQRRPCTAGASLPLMRGTLVRPSWPQGQIWAGEMRRPKEITSPDTNISGAGPALPRVAPGTLLARGPRVPPVNPPALWPGSWQQQWSTR